VIFNVGCFLASFAACTGVVTSFELVLASLSFWSGHLILRVQNQKDLKHDKSSDKLDLLHVTQESESNDYDEFGVPR
jgi:hypothetical protein